MGIPVYFKTLIDDDKNICLPSTIDLKVSYLLFDLNCLIHPCCVGLTNEIEMFHSIFQSIITIIDIVKPLQMIYLAIDGPCPRQKMHQQRLRRFKSSKQNKVWDTNAITPGTQFMHNLESYLFNQLNKLDVKFVLDTSNMEGEGEHKLYNYIKKHKLTNVVIYGLDADLIMLGLLSSSNRTYLFRERTQYNIECIDSEYIYFDINKLKELIISRNRPVNYIYNDMNIIYDYVFICLLLGNDFVQHTPSINLRYDGLDILLLSYDQLQRKYNGKFQLININSNDLIH